MLLNEAIIDKLLHVRVEDQLHTNAAGARVNLGLGAVENKSSATIRSELTSANATTALGYTPAARGCTWGDLTGN